MTAPGSEPSTRTRRRPSACGSYYGALLDDPRGVLRPGTSSLRTLDVPSLEGIDAGLVAGFVQEAVARHQELKVTWLARKAAGRA